ncbi:HNH endonuclease signature motif containing protein [Microbacterium sp. CIAB417]|uniref:HNH endonuclease signature motif containing protein n=1 Tax=Microbacterium sp. CIAB417 TaxID=2860287 RepID=UPI001FAD965D|nr:HNH endonuclease signature motif containing protein [Microbacterium sp. CIAB417]
MNFFTEIDQQITALRCLLGEDAAVEELAGSLRALSDDDLVEVMRAAAALSRCVERVATLGAGIIAARSDRSAGHGGLAQSRGHREPADLLQELTGGSRADATQRIRVGSTLLETVDHPAQDGAAVPPAVDGSGDQEPSSAGHAPTRPWHAPADDALLAGRISTAQHDAIVRGLDAPPRGAPDGAELMTDTAAVHEAWLVATEDLVTESAHRTLEELRSAARSLRDMLDPDGAERRYQERHNARSFRMWTDRDGVHHSSTVYDEHGYALIRSIHDAALRPRRGGPRFVDEADRQAAQELIEDPRTNEQLAYDLMIDLIHAGATAESATVFGVKQAGVRIVQTVGAEGVHRSAHTEDGLVSLPRSAVEQQVCDTGALPIIADALGNPLQVGREHRLFTPKQRIALAIRDGGCRWKNCDRPASYGEAHHIDEWSRGGRTDIDRGILLCRFHHMQLHNGGWRITRDGTDDFVLHHPSGETYDLPPRLHLRYAFADFAPPPKRFRSAA